MAAIASRSLLEYSKIFLPRTPRAFSSVAMRPLLGLPTTRERAAQVECTVLITGETGTGKEVWARLVHHLSPRSRETFIPVNCAALTPTLAESQLFGHERGAFTGSCGGESGRLSGRPTRGSYSSTSGRYAPRFAAQVAARIARRRSHSRRFSPPDKGRRASHCGHQPRPSKKVAEGRFREDLFYRLNLVELRMLPLRERVADIPLFIDYFSRRFSSLLASLSGNPREALRNSANIAGRATFVS